MSDLKRLKFQPDSSRLVCLIMVGTQVQFHKIPKIGFTRQILSDITHGKTMLSAYWHCKGIMRIWMYYYIVLLLSTANLLRIYCAWRYSMDLHGIVFHISMTAPLHSAGPLPQDKSRTCNWPANAQLNGNAVLLWLLWHLENGYGDMVPISPKLSCQICWICRICRINAIIVARCSNLPKGTKT